MNLLVTACYNLKDKTALSKRRFVFNKYQKLTTMCLKSFRKNLKDLDEVLVLEGTAENYHRMFQDIYYRIKKIYQAGDCNILWVDSDSVCVKPTRIFGRYDKFVMFDIQNQYCHFSKRVSEDLYKHLIPWMMSNVRYYPAGAITDKMWEMGDKIAENWVDVWAYECIIYNTLFHAQGMTREEIEKDIYNPRLNHQNISGDKVSLVPPDARIIHVHSTRDINKALRIMAIYLNKVGIKMNY